MKSELIVGNALDILPRLPNGCVNCCVTSPPYYNLRDYGVQGQIGTEATLEDYIKKLVEVFREVQRVLRQDGTLWLNMGDSYATSSGAQPPTNTRNKRGHTAKCPPPNLKLKDLMGVPWMLAFALRAEGWYLRQDIIWHKPNCMPESIKDRCTKSHEYLFLLSKNRKYYFDADAIREPFVGRPRHGERRSYKAGVASSYDKTSGHIEQRGNFAGLPLHPLGRNKRDVWSISTGGFSGAHFAVFQEKLVEPCILAGCPEGGVVLDPFFGSGTVGVVAAKNNRHYIGIEINQDYAELSCRRIKAAKEATHDN